MDAYELVRRHYGDWRRFRRWLQEQCRLSEEYWYMDGSEDGCALAQWVRCDLLSVLDYHTLNRLYPHADKEGNVLIRGTTRIIQHEQVPASEWHKAFSKKYHEHCEKEVTLTCAECVIILDEALDELGIKKNEMKWMWSCHQAYKDWRRFKKWLEERGKDHDPFASCLDSPDECALARWIIRDLIWEHESTDARCYRIRVNQDGSVHFYSHLVDMVGLPWHERFIAKEIETARQLNRRIAAEEALHILDKVVAELGLDKGDMQ